MSLANIFCETYENKINPVFKDLTNKEKEKLSLDHSYSYYKRGDIIYRQGEIPKGLLCLYKGKVKVLKQGIGRGQIIRLSKPLGFIGYRALFAEEQYMSSAVAIEDCSICAIDKKALFEVMNDNGKFALNMLKEMAQELGFSNERTVNLTQKHTRARLAQSLIFLIETFGFELDNKTLSVYLSRKDIASLSSMTTSNAIRTLSAFADEKLVQLDGKKIEILDIDKIKKIDLMG